MNAREGRELLLLQQLRTSLRLLLTVQQVAPQRVLEVLREECARAGIPAPELTSLTAEQKKI